MKLPSGYQLRAPEPEDLGGVAGALIADETGGGGESVLGEDFVQHEWGQAGFDLACDAWVVTGAAGTIAGYAQAVAEDQSVAQCWGVVHPAHRGRGIGTALLSLTEERASRLMAGRPGARMRHAVSAADRAAAELLGAGGLRLVRHFWHMQIDVEGSAEAPAAPEGTVIATVGVPGDLPAVHAVISQSFAGHWGYTPEPYGPWLEENTSGTSYDPSLWLLATAAGQPAGALIGHLSPDRGWVSYIGVLASCRGRGIGEALLRGAFAMFAARGVPRVTLSVDAGNATGATALYERVGMRVINGYDQWEKALGT